MHEIEYIRYFFRDSKDFRDFLWFTNLNRVLVSE